MSLVIGILTFVLIITSLVLIFLVLMQRAKTDGGMGSAMGGGAMESTFGADTNNVLSGATIKGAIVFFVVGFILYLSYLYQFKHREDGDNKLPTVMAPASTTPVAPLVAPKTATPAPVEPKKP